MLRLKCSLLAALTVAILAVPSGAFVLIGGAGAPPMVMDDCCKVILVPDPVLYLPAAGADAAGQRATLLADYPLIAPANVVLGGAAPGTLTVDIYAAMLYGADFAARYNDGIPGPSWTFPPPLGGGPSYRFIQEINTNMPLGGPGSPYIDPRPNDDPGGLPLPYYWTDGEAAARTNGVNGFGAYDIRFSDAPRRDCKNTHTTWFADLFIVDENRFTVPGIDPLHVITIHDGVRWGFEIWPKKLFARIMALIDSVFSSIDVTWSPAVWAHDLMGLTTVGQTYPGGIFSSPTITPPPSMITIPDTWPPTNYPPNMINFSASFMNPFSGLPAQVDIELVQLSLVSVAPIQVPALASPMTDHLRVRIDLSKDSITVRDANIHATDRQNMYNAVITNQQWSTFSPGPMLQIVGMRQFDFSLTPDEYPRGDMNGNRLVDGDDIKVWVATLLDPSPDPNLLPFGDFTMDDEIMMEDAPGMVDALLHFPKP